MKSLLISHDYLPAMQGGMEYYYHHLCRQLGGDMQVLTSERGDWLDFDRQQPYPIHRIAVAIESAAFRRQIKVGGLFFLLVAWTVCRQFVLYTWHASRLMRQEKLDYVIIGQLHLAPVGWLVRLFSGRPFAVSLHGSALSRYWHLWPVRWLVAALLNQADFLMVNSEFTRQQYLAAGVRATQRFIKVHPGIELERFMPQTDPEPIIKRHHLADRPVLLTVARLVEWKGQDRVIQAMPQILQSVSQAVYVIVGDGPYRTNLEQLVAELGLAEHVIFAGRVSDKELNQYYAAADVVVLVSREIRPGLPIEGFGTVYVEANAFEKPVVGTRLGGAPEAVLEGETGLLVDPTNPTEIAEAVVKLLNQPELARRLGQQGRRRAEDELTWARQAQAFRRQMAELFPNLPFSMKSA